MDGTALPSSDGAVIQALDSLIANITTLKSIVQSQIEILEDLRDIYENTNRTPAKRNCRNKNVVKIPVLQRAIEEIPVALITIDGVVEEREKYHEKLDVLLERVGRSKKYVLYPAPVILTAEWRNSRLTVIVGPNYQTRSTPIRNRYSNKTALGSHGYPNRKSPEGYIRSDGKSLRRHRYPNTTAFGSHSYPNG